MEFKSTFNDEDFIREKSRKRKKIIIFTILILCISLVAFCIYCVLNSSKVTVFKALKATSDQVKIKGDLLQKVTDKDFLKILKDSGTNQNIEVTMDSSSDPKLKGLSGYGIALNSLSDENKKQLMMGVSEKYKGKELFNTEFYTDNNKLMLSMPKLYDGWFVCDAENIQDQYNKSFFAENGKQMSSKEVSLKLFGDDNIKEYYGKELMNAIINGYISENNDKLSKLEKAIKVRTLKEKKTIEAGGQKEECKGYSINIPGNEAKIFVDSFCDYMLEDKHVNKMITKYANYLYIVDNKNYNNSEAMIDDIYSKMKENIIKFKEAYTCENVNGVVYVDPKGRAVSIELDTIVNEKDEKKNFKFSVDFRGYNNVANIIKMTIDLYGDKENFSINLNSSSTTKDDAINEDMKLVVHQNKEPLTFSEKYEYNTKTEEFNATVDLSSKKQQLGAILKGTGNYDKSKKILKFDFNTINLKAVGVAKPINISLTGSYSLAPIEKSIEAPSGESIELFKLSKDKFASIVQQIQKNMKVASVTANKEASSV